MATESAVDVEDRGIERRLGQAGHDEQEPRPGLPEVTRSRPEPGERAVCTRRCSWRRLDELGQGRHQQAPRRHDQGVTENDACLERSFGGHVDEGVSSEVTDSPSTSVAVRTSSPWWARTPRRRMGALADTRMT